MASKYIILSSTECPNIYPENSLTFFRNDLPNHSDLQLDNWHIALQSVSIDLNLAYTAPRAEEKSIHFMCSIDNRFWCSDNIFLNHDHYPDMTSIMQHINDSVGDRRESYYNKSETEGKKIEFTLKKDAEVTFRKDIHEWLGVYQHPHNKERVSTNIMGQIWYTYNNEETIGFGSKLGRGCIPKYLKISIDELEANVGGGGNILTTLLYDRSEGTKHQFYFEVSSREFIPFKYQELNTLSVRILDENNRQVKLLAGQATTLKLKMKRMNANDAFILRLHSSSNKNIYVDNDASNFRVQLLQNLELGEEEWEAALTSIQYPSKFTLSPEFISNMWMELDMPEWAKNDAYYFPKEHRRSAWTRRIPFLAEDLNSSTDMLAFIKRKVDKLFIVEAYKGAGAEPGTGPLAVSLLNKSITFIAKEKSILNLSFNLAYILQMTKGIYTETLSFPLDPLVDGGKVSGKVDLNRVSPHSMLVKCDILKPIMVGNKFEKILKLTPIIKKRSRLLNSSSIYESQHLDFIPIELKNINALHIELALVNGSRVRFTNKEEDTVVSILLRKRKHS